MYLSLLSTEDSGRGSSIPPSHGSILGSHTVSDHLPAQEGGLESSLTKESSGILQCSPTGDRRSSRASLEESSHSASSGEGHPLLSSGEGQEHPLLSLSLSQLQKPPPPTQDSSSVVFRNGFTPLHCAIRVSVGGEARGLCLHCSALKTMPLPYRMATSPRSPRRLRAGLTWSSPPPPHRPSGLWSSPSTMTIFK